MRCSLLALLFVGCAAEPGERTSAALAAEVTIRETSPRLPEGADPAPRVEVRVGDLVREGIAAARLGRGVVLVDRERRLLAVDARGETLLARDVVGRPVADPRSGRVAWAEADASLATTTLRICDASLQPRTLAHAPGPMTPFAWIGDSLVLLGSARGGVAGIWVANERRGTLACATNCELRTGAPWGSQYVPPPGDPASIRIVGHRLLYRAADGSEREATLPEGVR